MTAQPELNLSVRPVFDPSHLRFDGADYDRDRDNVRLSGQILRVYLVMRDGRWRTLDELEGMTGDPQASISAQLRHLRKPRFGSHTIERRHAGNGVYQYRMLS